MTTAATLALLLAAPAARTLDLRLRDGIAGSRAAALADPAPAAAAPPSAASWMSVAVWLAAAGSMAAAQALGARDETAESRAGLHSIQESAASCVDSRRY